MLLFLIGALLFLQEPEASPAMSVAEGNSQEIPKKFTSIDQLEKLNPSASYWVKVELKIPSNESYVLRVGNWYMKSVSFYDQKQAFLSTGHSITIDGPQESTYYLYYPFPDMQDINMFSISLEQRGDYLTSIYEKDVFQSAFLSILIFIFLVAAFFTLRSNDKVYFHYALYIISIIIFFSYQYGLLGSAISWVNQIPPIWVWIFSASLSFCYLLFARSFLNLKEVDPFNNNLLIGGQTFIGAVVLTETISYMAGYDILHEVWYKAIVLIVQFALMIIFLYRVFLLKTIISNIFLAGALILIVTTITGQTASTFKLVSETNQMVQTGLLLDALILSVGIAVRVGLIQKARGEAQKKLIDQLRLNEQLQLEYTEKLEAQVSERTSSLNKRNLENETLLKEVHHRVKNNLQMITSLLSMQQRRLQTESAKESLALTKNRVKSIGLIHEHLYRHEDFSKINLSEYVTELTNMLIQSLHRGNDIDVTIQIDDIQADIETAIPIGLILNELITNSIKYAYRKNSSPWLTIKVEEKSGELTLLVHDNGPGIPLEKEDSGFGHTIVNTLLESLSGTIQNKKSADGFYVDIKLKDYKVSTSHNQI